MTIVKKPVVLKSNVARRFIIASFKTKTEHIHVLVTSEHF